MSRKEDLVGRYGGEEFLIVLTNTDIRGAEGLAVRMLRDVPERKIAIRDLNNNFDTISYTSSMGVAEWDGRETFQDLIKRADEALYNSKGAGRNCATIEGDKVIRINQENGQKDVSHLHNMV